MRFTMNQTGAVVRAFQNNPTNSVSKFSLRSRSAKHITAGAIGLGLLFIVVANSQAQSTNYWWTGADNNGIWEDANNWVLTNGVAATTYPANPVTQPPGSETDVAIFTNSGTYAVTVTTVGNLNIQSNFFNNA